MSLREALRSTVARCTSIQMQPATFPADHATRAATTVQPMPANPHEIWVLGATGSATPVQLERKAHATRGAASDVAPATSGNYQGGPLTAHRVTADLLKAAMRVCDQHGDGDAARQAMRDQCTALLIHLQADLLQHFKGKAI